jgi:hypothetical protein
MAQEKSPEKAVVGQFTTYYNGDELYEFIDEDLTSRGRASGDRLFRILGSRAGDAADLLRAMAVDRRHPVFNEIEKYSMVGWNVEPELREKFAALAEAMASRIDEHLAGRSTP